MDVVLLTVLLTAGADYADPAIESARGAGEFVGEGEGYGGAYPYGATFGHGALHVKFGPMPQTCYAPRYGCYPGNGRDTHRYPAFHGWFYRRPYNYRNVFDYPWHAELHEPTSLFSDDGDVDESEESVEGVAENADEHVLPPAAASLTKTTSQSRSVVVERGGHREPVVRNVLRTIRNLRRN